MVIWSYTILMFLDNQVCSISYEFCYFWCHAKSRLIYSFSQLANYQSYIEDYCSWFLKSTAKHGLVKVSHSNSAATHRNLLFVWWTSAEVLWPISVIFFTFKILGCLTWPTKPFELRILMDEKFCLCSLVWIFSTEEYLNYSLKTLFYFVSYLLK